MGRVTSRRAAWAAVLGLAAALAGRARAQVATYNFNANTSAASSSSANASASTAAAGPGMILDYSLAAYPTGVLRAQTNSALAVNEAGAIAAGNYWAVTLAPAAGFRLDLTSVTFGAARGGASTPRSYHLHAGAPGFVPTASLSSAVVATERPTLTTYTAALPAGQFQGLTGPVEFRFYSSTPAAGQSLEYDNVTFNGAVTPVPEPAAALAVAAAALGAWCLRRATRRPGQVPPPARPM